MSTELSNRSADTGQEQAAKPPRLDQASLRDWLTTEVVVALPRWGLLAAGLLVLGLLLIALD